MKMAITGLGYVGLPLAIEFARSRVTVAGLDTDKAKVNMINRGRSYIKHIPHETIERVRKEKRFCALVRGQRSGSRCLPCIRAEVVDLLLPR
jgi:UDP-N-acetyl-D-glucosamine dehydrogenase